MENIKYIPGDLVRDPFQNGKICIVKSVEHNNDMCFTQVVGTTQCALSRFNALIGIPLTPQILEGNGWKMGSFKRDEDDFLFQPCYKRGSILNFDYYSELSIKPVVKETRSFLSAISDIKEIRLRKIKFVHELQHLLFGLGLNSELKV